MGAFVTQDAGLRWNNVPCSPFCNMNFRLIIRRAFKCLDVVEIYNPDGDFWREGPPMPSPLLSLRTNSTSAGAVDGKLYVCGGFHGAGTG